jgi:hypothetical protein
VPEVLIRHLPEFDRLVFGCARLMEHDSRRAPTAAECEKFGIASTAMSRDDAIACAYPVFPSLPSSSHSSSSSSAGSQGSQQPIIVRPHSTTQAAFSDRMNAAGLPMRAESAKEALNRESRDFTRAIPPEVTAIASHLLRTRIAISEHAAENRALRIAATDDDNDGADHEENDGTDDDAPSFQATRQTRGQGRSASKNPAAATSTTTTKRANSPRMTMASLVAGIRGAAMHKFSNDAQGNLPVLNARDAQALCVDVQEVLLNGSLHAKHIVASAALNAQSSVGHKRRRTNT